MEISMLTAFLGGILALISPCGALLLPAFFASNATRKTSLILHGFIFYLGLSITLIPLGLGVGALGSFVTSHRDILIAGTSILLVVLGTLQIFGFGFDFSRFLPGAPSLKENAQKKSGVLKTLLLGASSGIAGFCAGPILGAILTLAMAQGSSLQAGGLLAVYGLGMVIPLIILAATWHKISPKTLQRLRGKGFTFMGRPMHTTSVITGVIIVLVGILFWVTNGLVTMPSLLPTSTLRWIQSYDGILANPVWDIVIIVLVIIVGAAFWAYHLYKKQKTEPVDADSTSQ